MALRAVGRTLLAGTGLAGAVGGFYYLRWSQHPQIPVPPGSLLAELQPSVGSSGFHTDAFRMDVDIGQAASILTRDEKVLAFAKTFMTAPIFSLERSMLKKPFPHLPHPTDDEILKLPLAGGEVIALWTVAARRDGEVMLHWYVDPEKQGALYFAVDLPGTGYTPPPGKTALYLGSAIWNPSGKGAPTEFEDGLIPKLHKVFCQALLDQGGRGMRMH